MKCVLCGEIINTAIRVYMERRGRQKKSAFRNVCKGCYPKYKEEQGYKFVRDVDGIQYWERATQ